MSNDLATTFSFDTAQIVFGPGAAGETGERLRDLGARRALVVCDRFLSTSGLVEPVLLALSRAGVEAVLYDRVTGEPNEESVGDAVEAARAGFDGFVGIGGGSALDTAKLCSLFATHPGELLDYANAPIGRGLPIPGRVLPLIALPTTSGTGSEVTTVAVVDFPRLGTKTGVSHRYLRPAVAIVDPFLTISCPPGVTAAVGIDALLHALEAYTTLPFDARPALPPAQRPPYQGANPFSDAVCERAIRLVGRHLRDAVSDGNDLEARTGMALAGTTAGIAFSGTGVHIPHALSYPIASLGHRWEPPGYDGKMLIPHGFAAALTAAAVFRFIEDVIPARCATAARLLDGGDDLAASFEHLLEDVGAPTGLGQVGFVDEDIASLLAGGLEQHRLLVGSPKPAHSSELAAILMASM